MAPHRVIDRHTLSTTIAQAARQKDGPFIVALDGRSGAGKSTLAANLAQTLGAAVIDGDDFFAGGTVLRTDAPAARAAACIDWTRQRAVLSDLAAGRQARWRAFDWDAFDGRLCDDPTLVGPSPVVILEGTYAARPELSDLLDLRVLLNVSDNLRLSRLLAREGTLGPWDLQWHDAEEHYFDTIMPDDRFDLIIHDT
jgi:uridine kinase